MTFAEALLDAEVNDKDIRQLGWPPELFLSWNCDARFLNLHVTLKTGLYRRYYIMAADMTAEWEVRDDVLSSNEAGQEAARYTPPP
jgi:hypothetical protein